MYASTQSRSESVSAAVSGSRSRRAEKRGRTAPHWRRARLCPSCRSPNKIKSAFPSSFAESGVTRIWKQEDHFRDLLNHSRRELEQKLPELYTLELACQVAGHFTLGDSHVEYLRSAKATKTGIFPQSPGARSGNAFLPQHDFAA